MINETGQGQVLDRTAEEPIPFARLDNADPALMDELLAAVAAVAAAGAFTLGSTVETFESEFAGWCGADFGIGVSSGTAALELTLRALDLGPQDEVLVPTNSFVATAEAVALAGAKPVPIDVDPDTALITARQVEAACTGRTRCVIPVHLYGRTVDMDPIIDFCRSRGIAVIEDACQAHGARYEGRPVGSIGDAGCFSFYPTKNLGAWGDGGAVVTSDVRLAERVRLLRSHGESTRHVHEVVGHTHRLHALQAAILRVKLRYLDAWNEDRRAAGRALREALAGTGVGVPVGNDPGTDHVFHLFVIESDNRDGLRDHLAGCGIASGVHYPTPIHRQPAYASLTRRLLPVAEALAERSCSLPIFPGITQEQIERIAAAVATRPSPS